MKPGDPQVEHTVEKYLAGMKSKSYVKVPEKFYGKGGAGYLLQDWSFNRGKRAAKVSQIFKDTVYHQNTKLEHHIPNKILQRCKVGGIRFAVMKAAFK